MAGPAVPDLTLLLKKAEEGNLAAFLDGLLSKLSSTGWAYEQITSSSFIGCHPSNRDGQGISAGHVANLCSEIFDLGWCSSFQNPIAVECKPQNNTIQEFNERLVEESEKLPRVQSHLRFASLSSSHTNMVLRSFLQQVPHSDDRLCLNGKLSMEKLAMSDEAFHQACTKGNFN